MGPKRYARSVWFAITVFFAVLVLRSYQLMTYNPYPPSYTGVRCGMGAFFAFVALIFFGALTLISLIMFATREKH